MIGKRRRITPIGQRTLKAPWTPKRAHAFAMKRIIQIEQLLQEIAYTYDQIYQPVPFECDHLKDNGLKSIRDELDAALEAEAQI